MKKTVTRIIATILCVVMMMGIAPWNIFNLSAAALTPTEITSKLNSIKAAQGNGTRYWNGNKKETDLINALNRSDYAYGITSSGCKSSYRESGCSTNTFEGHYQCQGYARYLMYALFGAKCGKYGNQNGYSRLYTVSSLQPGDLLQFGNSHSAIVWKISGDTLSVADAWGSKNNNHLGCLINWGTLYLDDAITSVNKTIQLINNSSDNFVIRSNGVKVVPPTNSKLKLTDQRIPSGNLPYGKSYGIYGGVQSEYYNITKVKTSIKNSKNQDVITPIVDNLNTTFYSFRGRVNNEIIFNNTKVFKEDYYKFIVEVWDTKDYKNSPKKFSYDFTIGNPSGPNPSVMPAVFNAIVAVLKGLAVYLTVPQGTDVYYTTDGSDPATSKTKVKYIENSPIILNSPATVRSVAVKNGITSAETQRTINVEKVAQPTIRSELTNSDYRVSIGCGTSRAKIYYTLNGTTPTTSSSCYNGPISLKNSATVKAIAVKQGCSDSSVAQKTITVKAPDSPGIDIPTTTHIAVGDPIEVKWTAKEYASSHRVRIYKDGNLIKTVTVTGSRYVYTPDSSGSYTFGIDAVNFVGMSSSDSTKAIVAHDPVTVRFVNYDGTVIKEQKVAYGRSAVAPQTPKRKGWVFREWDSVRYFNVKSDVTIKALYDREKYIIRFVDENGIAIAPQQEVEYEGSVILPPDPSNGLAGYSFMGWRTISADNTSLLDYTNVDANLTLQAVFDWGNKDLPVAVQSASATKLTGNNHTVYTVSAKLNNGASETTYCRIIITLKTSTGKAVQTAIRDFTLSAKALNVSFSSGEIICDKTATKVELNIVGLDENGNRTGGAYSDSYLINSIDDQARAYYTEWSATRSYASNVEETKTMYRYRDKQFTTSTSSSLSGWTRYDSTTSYGAWSGNQTTTSYPGSSDTLQIVGQSTTYTYYHYCCNYYDGKNNVDSIVYGSGKHYYHEITRSSPLPAFNMADKGGKQAYGGSGSGAPICMKNGWYAWFLKSTTTTYTYQTRSKTTTYYFWRWGNWSNWSETPVSGSGNREVQTTTYYRYKITPQSTTEGEDNTGTPVTMSGSLVDKTALDLAGRKATIFVYKAQLNDPTANYIEYMGQTTIGAENTYDFTFVPAETPDEAESNFIVALAIEGQTSLFNIDVIEKTIKEQYQVDFYADGELINTQMVSEGCDAIVPEPPEIPGKVFVGWNNDTTNVIASRKVEAYYVDESYSIVFVDFETDFISMEQYNYGEVIAVPEPGIVEGKEFLGWEGLDEDDPIATEHAIYIAKYETGSFTVRFEDGYNNVISTQTVAYGEAAELPEAPEREGLVFIGWDQSASWWNVKQDMIVTPIWVYEDSVLQPFVSVENLYFGGAISAETDIEGATIYCAIDDGRGEPPITLSQIAIEEGYNSEEDGEEINFEGENTGTTPLHISFLNLFSTRAFAEEPDNTQLNEGENYIPYDWFEYDDSMIFDEDVTLYFYATADGMNDSEIVTFNYKYEPVMNPYEDHTGETYTVTFLDDDGFVLDEQTVNYFEDAVAPEVEEKEGYVFTGWDGKYDHVTQDIEVVAQYVAEDEYVTFALSNNAVTLTAGDTYTLNYTIENAPEDMGDIIWKSSDPAVATVSTDGLVMANQAGEAVITAKAGYNTASCKVTVLPNVNDSVTLRSNSSLTIENGVLSQIPIVLTGNRGVAATVGEIKEQLATPNVKIVDADGNELDDSKPIATNTQIRIIVDDIVIDAVIVIVTGDYDGNGSVNNRDASRIMRYLVNKENPDEYQLYASDVNKDGDVNNRDAAMVSRYLVGKETI